MVLYEKVFKAEDGTAIVALVNMEREKVEFKCFGKRHKRLLRFAGDRIGFIFDGRFYTREKEEGEKC